MAKKKTVKAKFVPLHDNVLIERDTADDKEKKTPGGVVIPTVVRKPPNTALVLAVGPDVEGIKAKDTIFVGKFSGTDIVVDDEDFVVIKADDVLGVYK